MATERGEAVDENDVVELKQEVVALMINGLQKDK